MVSHIVTAKEVLKRPGEFNRFFLGPPLLGNTYSIDDTKSLIIFVTSHCRVGLMTQHTAVSFTDSLKG